MSTTANPYKFTEPPGRIPRAGPDVVVEFLFVDRVPEDLGYDLAYKKVPIQCTLGTIPLEPWRRMVLQKTFDISDTNARSEMAYAHMEWWSHRLLPETRSADIRRM